MQGLCHTFPLRSSYCDRLLIALPVATFGGAHCKSGRISLNSEKVKNGDFLSRDVPFIQSVKRKVVGSRKLEVGSRKSEVVLPTPDLLNSVRKKTHVF